MRTLATIAQVPSSPVAAPPPQVSIPFEVMFFGGVGILFAGVKWLVGREFSRLGESLRGFDKRLDELERERAAQQIESATVNRLDQKVVQLDNDVQGLKQVLTALPRIESKVDHIDDLKTAVTTLGQRFDNLGLALNQTQDLFHSHQKDLTSFRAEAARTFVPKEDDTRYKAVMDAKMEALWGRIDRVVPRPTREDS